jgi:murein DD-endopeptidase MepM/ murein hydrolase activator NlpD
VAALLGAGCGQIGSAHDAAEGQPAAAGAYPGAGGDAGGVVQGPQFSGDPTLPQKGHHGKRVIVTTVTTTTSDPATSPIPQFHLRVAITNTSGPLYACPVQGPFHVGDDFGQPRYTTNPPHPHGGNDIFAPRGTPIIAPFNGVATVDAGGLGGNGVRVTGADGYVYNAHLEAYGTLGRVHTGQVVGYVGNSGDAAGGATHDHFEWHPYHPAIDWVSPYGYRVVDAGNPPAVDPYPYLRAACS